MSQITIDRLFYGAYRDARVPNTPLEQTGLSPDQVEEARQLYNRMVDAWDADGLMIKHKSRTLFTLTAGQGDYTVGPSGDFDCDWQERIDKASIVLAVSDPSPEYPIWPLSEQEWQRWTLKTQQADWSRRYYYEKDYPLGIMHLLYVPSQVNQIALYIEHRYIRIDATGDTILDFPPNYQEMIETNLAVNLAARTEGSQISPLTVEKAYSSRLRTMDNNRRPLKRENDLAARTQRTSVFDGNRYSR